MQALETLKREMERVGEKLKEENAILKLTMLKNIGEELVNKLNKK